MKKRLLSILLVATMLLAMIPAMMVAVSAENTTPIDWANDKIITIYTADELVEFKKQISKGNFFAGRTVKLGADIDMTGKTLSTTPNDYGFCGVFDGQFHTIRNITFTYTQSSYQAALFGSATVTTLDAAGQQAVKDQGGIIVKNFALVNSTITSNKRTSALYAWVFGDLTVENVYISAKVAGNGGDCTGGFIGDAAVGKISFKNCAFEGTVTNGTANVSGAFVGRLRNDKTPTVVFENCLNASEVALVGTTFGGTTNKETATNCLHYNEANKETIGSGFTANAPAGFTKLSAGCPVPTPLALPFFSAKMIDWTADEIVIVTADQFVEFKQQIENANYFVGKTVKLGADIDLTGKDLPGSSAATGVSEGFYGTFDGQFHTISNLTFSKTYSYQGALFGAVDSSVLSAEQKAIVEANGITVKNFSLVDSTVNAGARASALYGWVFASLTVENVYINADVTASGDCTGGYIGDAAVGTITFKNCMFEGTVVNKKADVGCGAFVGRIRNDKTTTVVNIENCLNASDASWAGSYFSNDKKENLTNSFCYDAATMGGGFGASVSEGFTAMNASYPVPTTLLPFFADRVEDNRTAKDEGVKLVTEFYGIQLNADKTAVRLVGAVNSAVADLSAVGYEVSIIRDNGKVWSTTLETQAVYTSVLEDGKAEATTAADCGGDYVYVAAVDGLQANKGVITLMIKTYSIDQDNNKIYTDMSIVSYDSALVA